jgi:thiol-disulfide isomerase/thioredoxin
MENTPQAPKAPDSSPATNRASSQSKLLAGALLAIALVVGLHYINRFWIAPAVRAQTKAEASHPLAPPFSLTDLNGTPLNLSDFQGKVVALDFWATWCEPCRIEIPGFIELQKRYAAQGFTMIGISMDEGPEPVVKFYRELQMNYPVAIGNDRLGELYGGMMGLPTTFLIGRDGRVYAKHVGAFDVIVFETEIKELLSASPNNEVKNFRQAAEMFEDDKIDMDVPGIDLSKLNADEKQAFKKKLSSLQCPCGCKYSLLKCRRMDRQCRYSLKLAQAQLDAFLKERAGGPATP